MSSSRRAQDTSQQTPAAGLKVTLPVLVTASVLFLAALVLAYLGGVMTGRAQWASSLEESRAALAAAAAMAVCELLERRLHARWLENFDLAASMLVAMAAAVGLNRLL